MSYKCWRFSFVAAGLDVCFTVSVLNTRQKTNFRWRSQSVESAAPHPDQDNGERNEPPHRKYHQSLQTLKPIRFSSPQWVSSPSSRHRFPMTWLSSSEQDWCSVLYWLRSHPVDNAGFLSFTIFAWITPMMWAVFRNKLDLDSLKLSPFDGADVNTERSGSTSQFFCCGNVASVLLTGTVCDPQAPEDVEGGSGKGGPGEGLVGASHRSLSENQTDCVCRRWCCRHGSILPGPGKWKWDYYDSWMIKWNPIKQP